MEIHRESTEKHSIQSYTHTELRIDNAVYKESIAVNKNTIVYPWIIPNKSSINLTCIEPLLILQPEIIIFGWGQAVHSLPPSLLAELSQRRIGVESMALGAACRTFNVLLNEGRAVCAGFIL